LLESHCVPIFFSSLQVCRFRIHRLQCSAGWSRRHRHVR